jgi:hypothetical protein
LNVIDELEVSMKIIKYLVTKSRAGFSVWGAVAAVTLGLCGATAFTTAHAQATTSTIFGKAPAGAIIRVSSATGIHRNIPVDAKGHYQIAVPVNVYTVTMERDGQTVGTHPNVQLIVGRGAQIDFPCDNNNCEAAAGG